MTDETAPVTEETAHTDTAHTDTAHTDSNAATSDDHGHDGPALGPIDWGKWAFAIVGGLGGLIVLGFFLYALGGLPA